MPTTEVDQQVKNDILLLYGRYFGSIMANNYLKFYEDKDIKTVLASAGELFEEYAGEAKGKEILDGIIKKNNLKLN